MRRYVALSRTVRAAYKYFLFLGRFNSTKSPSKTLCKEVFSNLVGISFRMYKRIAPPLSFLPNLIGAAYPSIVNWLDRNV